MLSGVYLQLPDGVDAGSPVQLQFVVCGVPEAAKSTAVSQLQSASNLVGAEYATAVDAEQVQVIQQQQPAAGSASGEDDSTALTTGAIVAIAFASLIVLAGLAVAVAVGLRWLRARRVQSSSRMDGVKPAVGIPPPARRNLELSRQDDGAGSPRTIPMRRAPGRTASGSGYVSPVATQNSRRWKQRRGEQLD